MNDENQKMVRVLRPSKLLGKDRKFGELIEAELFFSLNDNVQQALISGEHVEILKKGTQVEDNALTSMERQQAQIERLLERVTSLEERVARAESALNGGIETLPKAAVETVAADEDDTTVAEPAESVEEKAGYTIIDDREPNKDDTVLFIGEDDEQIKGIITSLTRKDKVAKVAIDDTKARFSLSFDDLTIITEV